MLRTQLNPKLFPPNKSFQLIESDWSNLFKKIAKEKHTEIQIISPFIKKYAVNRLLGDWQPKSIQVITRFNLDDFCKGVSDTSALRLLLEKGAKVRGVRNLHAKLYLFGKERVVVTSANLTKAALERNHEFGFIANDPTIIAESREYFDNLWKKSGGNLKENQLDEWESQLNRVLAGGARPSQSSRLPDEGVDAGVSEIPIVLPVSIADAPQAFVKFFGTSRNRTERTTQIIDEVRSSGCHWACTYPKGKRPRQVKDGAVIFMGKLVRNPNDTIIYGRAIGMSHLVGRDDATQEDINLRGWKKKWPHYIRVHHAEFVAGTLEHGISLSQLMQELQSLAFESTKRNSTEGSGNLNPRHAYGRMPAVKLSDEGYSWVSEKLEAAFQEHGKLAPAELEKLDWPAIVS